MPCSLMEEEDPAVSDRIHGDLGSLHGSLWHDPDHARPQDDHALPAEIEDRCCGL